MPGRREIGKTPDFTKIKGPLRISYEPETDILTIYLRAPEIPVSHSSEAEPGVVLNHAEDGSLSSVEIREASKCYPPGQLAAYSVNEFIDLKTASKLSDIATVTLKTQAEKRRLWAMRLNGQWMTTRKQLQHYLDTRARKSQT